MLDRPQISYKRQLLLFLAIPLILSSIPLLCKPSLFSLPTLAAASLKPTRLFRQFATANISTSFSQMAASNLKITPRLSQERGHANHDWLRTFHTFNFASYYGPHDSYGALRVINEDRVAARNGFGTHSHREFEIFSYIVAGQLEHKDSMGNVEVLKRGDLQLTSAGTGISHSEKAYGSKEVHFLQIWSLPSVSKLTPKYFTRHFTEEEKKQGWVRIVAPVSAEGVILEREASGPAPVQSDLTLYSTLLPPGTSRPHKFPGSGTGKKAYIQVVQTSGYNTGPSTGAAIKIGDGKGTEQILKEGDGAYLLGEGGHELKIENVGEKVAEVLLFDL